MLCCEHGYGCCAVRSNSEAACSSMDAASSSLAAALPVVAACLSTHAAWGSTQAGRRVARAGAAGLAGRPRGPPHLRPLRWPVLDADAVGHGAADVRALGHLHVRMCMAPEGATDVSQHHMGTSALAPWGKLPSAPHGAAPGLAKQGYRRGATARGAIHVRAQVDGCAQVDAQSQVDACAQVNACVRVTVA